MTHMKYAHRPSEVEAMQLTTENAVAVAAWCEGIVMPGGYIKYKHPWAGWMHVTVGAWVVKEPHDILVHSYTVMGPYQFEKAYSPIN